MQIMHKLKYNLNLQHMHTKAWLISIYVMILAGMFPCSSYKFVEGCADVKTKLRPSYFLKCPHSQTAAALGTELANFAEPEL